MNAPGLPALPDDAPQLAAAWAEAAWAPEIDAALRDMHAEVAEAVAAHRPTCVASGRCCRFEEYGHRLYVTGLEAAWCLRGLGRNPTQPEVAAAVGRGDCPFLEAGRCGAHPWRPLGCRTFHCDGADEGWQQALTERLVGRLRSLHDAHGIPYRYGEWRTMLAYFAT